MIGRRTKNLVRMAIGIIVSVFFLWLVFREIDVQLVIKEVRSINSSWLIPAILVYFFGVWVRTARWRILMRPITHQKTSRLFPIYVISYMANNILPMRIGDIYRAYIVGRKETVSKSATLVTIGVERIFDGLTMLMLLFISILFFPIENKIVRQAATFGSIIFILAICTCYIVILKKKWMEWIYARLTRNTRFKNSTKLREIYDNLLHGLDSLKEGGDILQVSILSIGTWLIEATSYYLTLNAFGFFGSFLVAIATMALVNLVIIIPSGPGYFGLFEAACLILGPAGYADLTGFTENVATAYALILHVVVQWVPSTLLGLVFMWNEHISFKEIEAD